MAAKSSGSRQKKGDTSGTNDSEDYVAKPSVAGAGEKATVGVERVDKYCPAYWQNTDPDKEFNESSLPVADALKDQIQALIDATFRAGVKTRDRKVAMPSRMEVMHVFRFENSQMWNRYLDKRNEICDRGTITPVEDLDGMDRKRRVRTTHAEALGGEYAETMAPGLNEHYLWHGTSPMGAIGIAKTGFRIDLAGSNVGTMFGKGAYLAEASSKGDEYACEDESGMYDGVCALLLCRTCLGETFYMTDSDPDGLECAAPGGGGEYDSVLGDRERVRGTYREFVCFDEGQIYPEYIVLYKRVYDNTVL